MRELGEEFGLLVVYVVLVVFRQRNLKPAESSSSPDLIGQK